MGDHDQREPGQPVDSEPVASLDRRRRLKALERVAEAVERDEPVGPEMTRDLHTGGNLSPVPDILRRPLRTIGEAGDDWLRCRPPDRDHLLMREGRGALNQGAVGMLVGPGGRGKSWLLCQLALSVATGRDWLDYFEVVRPGRVLLALAEEDGHEIWRRLYWAARAMKLTDEEADAAAANIVPLPLRGTPVGLVEGENRSVGPTAAFHALREQLGRDDYRLVVLDPLARFAPDVESNNAAATAAVQVVEELTKGPGHPTVIVCHHSNKESRKTGSEGGPGMNRGVTGLHDAARWEAQLLGKGEDDLALKLSKGNYVPPGGEPIPLERRDGEYGFIRAIDPEVRAERAAEAEAEKLRPIKQAIRKIISANPECTKGTVVDLAPHGKPAVTKALKLMMLSGEVVNVGEEGERKAWKLVLS